MAFPLSPLSPGMALPQSPYSYFPAATPQSPFSSTYTLAQGFDDSTSPMTLSRTSSTIEVPVSAVVLDESLQQQQPSPTRIRHRLSDTDRRLRESAAIGRLKESIASKRPLRSRVAVIDEAVVTIDTLRAQLAAATRQLASRKRTRYGSNGEANEDDDQSNGNGNSHSVDTKKRFLSTTQAEAAAAVSKAQSSVVTRESFFMSLFALSSAIQLVMNADTGIILFMNDAFIRFTGFNSADLIGKQMKMPRSVYLSQHPDDIDEDPFHEAITVRVNGVRVSLISRRLPFKSEFKHALSRLYRNLNGQVAVALTARDRYDRLTNLSGSAWLSSVNMPTSLHSPTLLHVVMTVSSLYEASNH